MLWSGCEQYGKKESGQYVDEENCSRYLTCLLPERGPNEVRMMSLPCQPNQMFVPTGEHEGICKVYVDH